MEVSNVTLTNLESLIGRRVMVMTDIPRQKQIVEGNMSYGGVVKEVSPAAILIDYGNSKKYECALVFKKNITSILVIKRSEGQDEEAELDG